ncbi:nucleotidyltransferase domain-containing protein [Kribbella sp. CA-293567]|uniref:nucleotidyltransferase domain-containing protein n=1 Tax=Kribbella sp. CA-293567 TaxID=3002436 RepID=UPI0022DE1F10|nr:nucleotidyltransferase domain-containing protein [Kribbella sp. CA-293567]WBQ06583.1 nucleotidyltransferase domain-containing protein [Kribbella sp. CA-293567]
MQFSDPLSAAFPGLHGRVLGVLVKTERALTGRALAGLLHPPASYSGVQKVLDGLVRSGLVFVEPAGRAKLYTMNREHLAAAAISELASLRELFISRLQAEAETWEVPAAAVWLFGSTSRGQGGPDSDIDILVVRPDEVSDSDPRWLTQLETLAEHATRWTGNPCEIVEYSSTELQRLVRRRERLVTELRRDAVPVAGTPPHQTLTRKTA